MRRDYRFSEVAMRRPFTSNRVPLFAARKVCGFTIVEVLVATALTLLMMAAVVTMFGRIGNSVTDARSTLEMTDKLRAAALRMQMDLAGVTVAMLPPRRPENNEGYFEYIEGPVGVAYKNPSDPNNNPADPSKILQPWDVAVNTTDNASANQPDTTVIDFDDILMFTTRSNGRPFVGRYWDPVANQQSAIESDVAEVAWFVRGRTLYRRVLLVAPSVNLTGVLPANFYAKNDISVRYEIPTGGGPGHLAANTLGDLTRRECRFAHPIDAFPFDARRWGQLGLPTLRECSSPPWDLSNPIVPTSGDFTDLLAQLMSPNRVDFWSNVPSSHLQDYLWINLWKNQSTFRWKSNARPFEPPAASDDGSRIAEDVILNNVIGFDVKLYDPGVFGGTGGYVDLGYSNVTYGSSPPSGSPGSLFYHLGVPGVSPPAPAPGLDATTASARVYDTGSSHYETEGRFAREITSSPRNDSLAGRGVNGFDDTNSGVVDGPNDLIAPPPYPVPLRGVQVKIRVFEPDSRQVREVTVVQDFLPK